MAPGERCLLYTTPSPPSTAVTSVDQQGLAVARPQRLSMGRMANRVPSDDSPCTHGTRRTFDPGRATPAEAIPFKPHGLASCWYQIVVCWHSRTRIAVANGHCLDRKCLGHNARKVLNLDKQEGCSYTTVTRTKMATPRSLSIGWFTRHDGEDRLR